MEQLREQEKAHPYLQKGERFILKNDFSKKATNLSTIQRRYEQNQLAIQNSTEEDDSSQGRSKRECCELKRKRETELLEKSFNKKPQFKLWDYKKVFSRIERASFQQNEVIN